MSQFFAWGGQSTGVSASTSVLPMNTQDWSPLGWTGWISLQLKGLSRVFSNTTVQKHQFFSAQVSLQSNSHIHTWPLEKPWPWPDGLYIYIYKGNDNPRQYSCLENPMDGGAQWAAVHGVAKSQMQLSNFTFTSHFHALEREMATHSSVLAWRIPGMAESGGLPTIGSHRVGHD